MKANDILYYRNPNATFPTWKRVKFEMRIDQGEIKLSEGTTFDLTKSVMRWIGLKHSKICILLEEQKKKGKVYLIGSDSEEEVKQVHEKIRKFIIDFNTKESEANGGAIEDPKPKDFTKMISFNAEDLEKPQEHELIFETHLPDLFLPFANSLSQDHKNLGGEEDFESVFTSDTFRISQSKENKNLFKFNVTIEIPAELLIETLQDYTNSMAWNSMIAEVSLFQKLHSKTYIVLKEDRKLASKLFNYSREFIFARCFFSPSKKPPFFILEKSVEVADDPDITRGEIKKAIYMIRPSTYNKGSSIMEGEVEIYNKGLINSSTDTWLTVEYIKQMMNLEQFVSEKEGCGSFQDLENALDLKNIPERNEGTTEYLSEKEFIKSENHNFHSSVYTEDQVDALIAEVESNIPSLKACNKKFQLSPIKDSKQRDEMPGLKKEVVLDISKGWERTNQGVEFVDYELIKTQHRILGFLLKKMGKNLLMGKSILGISLPVEIFDSKSVLGRIAEKFMTAPKYFNSLNSKSSDEDITSGVVSFLLTSLVVGIEQHKPFNPILGETYQCWIDGCPLYMEQTFHHPPISSFIMYGPNFKLYGSIEFTASLHLNSASARQLGVCTLELLDCKREIKFIFPIWNVNGVTFGRRMMVIEGKSYIAIPHSNTLVDLLFNPNKKGVFGGLFGGKSDKENSDANKLREDYFQINILKVKPGIIEKVLKIKDSSEYKEFDLKPATLEKNCFGSGIWHTEFKVGNNLLWSTSRDKILSLIEEDQPLPSDSKYRQDLISFRSGNMDRSQKLKEVLEEFQRTDRKLRAGDMKGGKSVSKK